MRKSSELDSTDENANYDGCQPCPRCKSRNRQRVVTVICGKVFDEGDYLKIRCCDCGFRQTVTKDWDNPQGGE